MCLNNIDNYWHFHKFYNHLLFKWLEKKISITELFRKPRSLLGALMRRRPEKKKMLSKFPLWLVDLRIILWNGVGYSLLFFHVCVKSSTSNLFANGMLPSFSQALTKHIHLTMSFSNHSKSVYVTSLGNKLAPEFVWDLFKWTHATPQADINLV